MATMPTPEVIPDQQTVQLGQQIQIAPESQGTIEHSAASIGIMREVLAFIEAKQAALPNLKNVERDAVWSVLDFFLGHGNHQLNLLTK